MIFGIGIDVVDIAKFKAIMEKRGERFLKRLFTDKELSYCMAQKRPEAHLSGRLAAKVSLFKAVGRQIGFKNVEISREAGGRPVFTAPLFEGEYTLDVSISHTSALAIAETIAGKKESRP
ncbi:holo-[acyl-carrier-protein] synthase [bacterium]|nr:MAG: holo-[acyl-carrier-protein] synthase [bacterium]